MGHKASTVGMIGLNFVPGGGMAKFGVKAISKGAKGLKYNKYYVPSVKQNRALKAITSKIKKSGKNKNGKFSISNWDGYPKDGIKPKGPFRLLEGKEYNDARKSANNANRSIHRKNPSLKGREINEIHPVKLGGRTTSKNNKIALNKNEHQKYTNYWNKLQSKLKIKVKKG